MPPTFKDSSAVFSSAENAARPAGSVAGGAESGNPQPVALEVPVTVNGARAVEGSEKREPFSETTSTVLVLAKGAVVRLAASVAPGQLLFLTNEKTKKEVVCQVVKSKNDRNVSGYVELEFTQPVLGFWGMRFPGERSAPQSSAALNAATQNALTQMAGPKVDAAFPAASVSAQVPELRVGSSPEAKSEESVLDFKTEIKADSRPLNKADLLAPAETSTEALKLETNRLQEQLSALLFAEQKQSESQVLVTPPTKQELGDAAAKIFEMAESEAPAPKSEASAAKADVATPALATQKGSPAHAKSSFDDEEVKIPAWLEPLARNAAIPAPPEPEPTPPALEERHTPVAKETSPVARRSTPSSKRAPTPALFGNTLLGESAAKPLGTSGSGKGIWIGAIAAGLLVAAGGGAWYFRDSQMQAHAAVASNASPIGAPAAALPSAPPASTSPNVPQSPLSSGTPEVSAPSSKANSSNPAVTESASPASSGVQGKVQTAAISERIPKSSSNTDALPSSAKAKLPAEPIEPEVKRPSLGKVRLAKPKVGRAANEQVTGEMEPALEVDSDGPSSGESSLSSGLIAGSANQPAAPAAPLPVGGEVKAARMISSVPPVYPALARTQHVSGDVRIDALIDATGRVTTMKVVTGPTLLQQSAMDALRQWKYQPATLGGKAVPMHLTVTIQFRLQ